MAKIIINKSNSVNGKLSIVTESNEGQIVFHGQLATHRYFEEITSIESERYILKNIEVYRESFGSNDFNVLYDFKAKDFEVKGGETNLPQKVIDIIEEDLYKDEEDELLHEEVYTKWKADMN